jgi:hypothetical protein
MNLDIEGTKHEKVVIIVLAYVMGFTAGFICFGISAKFNNAVAPVPLVSVAAPQAVEPTESTPTADATEPATVEETVAASPAANNLGVASVTYTEGKLQAGIGANTYLLSMKTDSLDSTEKAEFKKQGTHTDIPAYSVSPDNNWIFFCEQQTTDDSCNAFMFDVANNVIKYVSADGKKLSVTAAVAKAATWSDKGFTLDGKTSTDATNPSVLGTI